MHHPTSIDIDRARVVNRVQMQFIFLKKLGCPLPVPTLTLAVTLPLIRKIQSTYSIHICMMLLKVLNWIFLKLRVCLQVYDFITNDQSVNVVLENPLDENDYPMYYEPAYVGIARNFGGI